MYQHQNILIFDGVCNLCNGLVNFILKRDRAGKIKYSPLQSEHARALLREYSLDPEKSDSVVYISGNTYYLKSTAILRLFSDIGRGWRLLYGFIIIPRFIRDLLYDFMARNRYRVFGRRDTCRILLP